MTEVKNFGQIPGGWMPDTPDHRDLSLGEFPDTLREALCNISTLPCNADLRQFFADVEDQGQSSATSAFACGALVEYFNRLQPELLRIRQQIGETRGVNDFDRMQEVLGGLGYTGDGDGAGGRGP